MRKAISVILVILVLVRCGGQGTPGPVGKDGITPRVEILSDSSGLEIRVCYGDSCGPWYFLPAGLNGIDGKDGQDGKDGIQGPQGEQGLPGKDAQFPDTAWVRYKFLNDTTARIVLWDTIPPPYAVIDTSNNCIDYTYTDAEGFKVHVLKGDSLKIAFKHGWRDINGKSIDSLRFHIAYEDSLGKGHTAGWMPLCARQDDLVFTMRDLPIGKFTPAVRAVRKDWITGSTFTYSKQYGWYARRVK